VSSVDCVRDVAPVNDRTFVITYDGPSEGRADLLIAIQGLGLRVESFSPVGLPLEMMYMDLVKESR
jgi:hypothetical protein